MLSKVVNNTLNLQHHAYRSSDRSQALNLQALHRPLRRRRCRYLRVRTPTFDVLHDWRSQQYHARGQVCLNAIVKLLTAESSSRVTKIIWLSEHHQYLFTTNNDYSMTLSAETILSTSTVQDLMTMGKFFCLPQAASLVWRSLASNMPLALVVIYNKQDPRRDLPGDLSHS